MKFRATLSSVGCRRLEKGFLPCLEKHGKSCTLLLDPTDVHIVQQGTDTDGMQLTFRWAREVLFEIDSYRCTSKHHNLIAFSFEVALLLRVLRSASSQDTDNLEVKLAMRATAGSTTPKPYLAFSSQGVDLNMQHELPVSKPLSASEIDRLNKEKDVAEVCPFYVDLLADAMRLQAVVDKLKNLSQVATLTTTKQGNVYLQVSSAGVHMASEVQGLVVLPHEVAKSAAVLTSDTPEERLEEARQVGDAAEAVIQLKHFARTLHSMTSIQPGQALVGIAEDGGFVHFMFAFADLEQANGYDDNISLSCKVPVKVEE